MAVSLCWIPDTLYNLSIVVVAANYDVFEKQTRELHQNSLFDIYYQLYKRNHLKTLGIGFANLEVFKKLLKVKDQRSLLHHCFQAIMDHGCPIADDLSKAFQSLCWCARNLSNSAKKDVIQFGFSLGSFLLDAGWFSQSEIVFLACLSLCHTYTSTKIWQVILQCHARLLCIRNVHCKFRAGQTSFNEANECIVKIKELGLKVNFACIYAEFSSFYFSKNDYKEAYRWSFEALKELNSCLYPREIIRVLCQAAKACVLKREFKRSEMLIKQALYMARKKYGSYNVAFASALLDYGYYLMNLDNFEHALKAYQTALNVHIHIFGGNNLLVAKCHENLAYTSYVYEYSSGRFKGAMDHAEKALEIMDNLLDDDNFMLVSAKNLKALILEEMAVDSYDSTSREIYFQEAQELHHEALQFAIKEFGELNLLTAKYYGNLGRLYQSMVKFKDAQKMMQKAVAIKESILGPDDYEVAISINHLASLYTYDLDLHSEAEVLFLRSIEISKKLFGEGYSGLEYDYKGLLRIYSNKGLRDEVRKYQTLFNDWKELRDGVNQEKTYFSPLSIELEPIAPENMMSHFISVQ